MLYIVKLITVVLLTVPFWLAVSKLSKNGNLYFARAAGAVSLGRKILGGSRQNKP